MRTQVYLDGLARKAPDLLSRVQAGELKPKTAARMAGIVKVPTTYEQIVKLLDKLTGAEERRLAGLLLERTGGEVV